MSDDTREDQMADLIAKALELLDGGEELDVAALCDGDAAMADRVSSALRRAGHMRAAQAEPVVHDPMAGVLLAERYRIDERIGAGAMGVVYRATDLQLQRLVAVKLLRPELVAGERFDARLAREGEVLASIRHPSVLTVHDRGHADDGRTFLAIELLDGASGAELLADDDGKVDGAARLARMRQRLGPGAIECDSDVRQVVRWIAAAADGLAAAHAEGVVHRDVKPSNMFVERSGRVVVLDFGIVSLGASMTLGSDDSPLGTPAFMAPEQLDAGYEPDARTDVYGLAATLFQFLTGSPPFAGSVQQVLAAIARGDTPRADEVRPGLPRDLLAVVEKGMARVPGDRYPSASALREDLVAWLEHRPVMARRLSRTRRAIRRARRSPTVRALAAGAVMLAVGVAGYAWREHVAQQNDHRWWSFSAEVPPSLLAAPSNFRATSAVSRSEAVRRVLDGLVDTGLRPHIGLTLRAIQRSDGGDLAGAAADMRALAAAADAPFAEVAARSYAAGKLPDEAALSVTAAQLGGAANRFAIACHVLRCQQWSLDAFEPIVTELAREDAAWFAEVMLVARLRRASGRGDLRAIEDEAIALRERRGRPSGVTSYLLANVRIGLGRPQEADDDAAAGVELCDEDPILVLLAGNAAFDLFEIDRAEAHLRRAVELQTRSERAHLALFECLLSQQKVDAAADVLAQTPFRDDAKGRVARIRSEGVLLFVQAMMALPEGQAVANVSDEAARLAQQAQDVFRQLPRSRASRSFAEIACDLLVEPSDRLRDELLDTWAKQPLDVPSIRHVSRLLAGDLSARSVQTLTQALERLADGLVGRDQ